MPSMRTAEMRGDCGVQVQGMTNLHELLQLQLKQGSHMVSYTCYVFLCSVLAFSSIS